MHGDWLARSVWTVLKNNKGSEYGELIAYLRENTPGGKGDDVIFSTHCHNGLGLATANTIAAGIHVDIRRERRVL